MVAQGGMTLITLPSQLFGRFTVVIMALLAAFLYINYAPVVVQELAPPTSGEVIYRDHAVKKHGNDARLIRRCLEDYGARQVWRSRSWRTPLKFFRTCLLPDGREGMQIVQWSWRLMAYRELTAFVIKDGRGHQIKEYLTAVAVQVK